MNTSRLGWALLPLTLVIGCASDPNKNLKEARNEEAEAVRAQRVGQAEVQKDMSLEKSEAKNEAVHQQASAYEDGTKNRMAAEGNMKAERDSYTAKAQERLDRVKARLQEAKRKIAIAGNKAPLTVKTEVDAAMSAHATVANNLRDMQTVTDDNWKTASKATNDRIEELENVAEQAHGRANSMK